MSSDLLVTPRFRRPIGVPTLVATALLAACSDTTDPDASGGAMVVFREMEEDVGNCTDRECPATG